LTDLSTVSADAFLLPVGTGYRFCLLRLPANRTSLRGSMLVAPPFAEELNKSRRMIALAAERIAASGYAVLQIDCLGCGDSSGDFSDATWEQWISDLTCGYEWLERRYPAPMWIWGVRAGALLATAALEHIADAPNLVFWQPVVSGRQHLMQFLRMLAANEFLGEGASRSGTQETFKRLTEGEVLEIAGYVLTPALALGLAAAGLNIPHGFGGRIVCLELGPASTGESTPAVASCVHAWRETAASVSAETVNGIAFWQTQQITEATDLIEVTLSRLRDIAQ
jgi:exosortase A-associated hydrolase 2